MNKTQIRDLIKKAANRKKGIGAIPVGLKFTIAGVKMYVEAQYDIYNKVHINIIEQGSLKTVVKIDGVAKNKKDQIEKLYKFVVNNSTETTEKTGFREYDDKLGKWVYRYRDTGYKLADEKKLVPVKKIVDQLSSEVNIANNPGKVATKRSPVRKPVNISPSRAGFVFRLSTDGIVEVPKNTVNMIKFPQVPKLDFFAVKIDNRWSVIELRSGLSLSTFGNTKKGAIDEASETITRVIDKNGADYFYKTVKEKELPKQYLDKLDQYKKPAKTMTRPAAVKSSTATKTARKVIANRAAKSRPAAVKVKTASKTARKATATRTATKKAKSKPTGETGILKYSKRLGNGKYEYKYVKKR